MSKGLDLWDGDRFAIGVPVTLNILDYLADVGWWGLNSHLPGVDDLTQDLVVVGHRHVLHLIKGGGVLARQQVRLT